MNILTSIVFVLAVLTVVSRASASPMAQPNVKASPLNGIVEPIPRETGLGRIPSNCELNPWSGLLACTDSETLR